MSRAKTKYMCLNGTPLGSVNMQSAQLPQVTEFKYMGSTLQSDDDMSRGRGDVGTVKVKRAVTRERCTPGL